MSYFSFGSFLAGFAGLLLATLAPQPMGSIVFFGLAMVHFGIGSRVARRRADMRYLSAGFAVVAGVSAIVVGGELAGYSLRSLSLMWSALTVLVLCAGTWLIHLERKTNPLRWARWSTHWEHAGIVNRLTFRQAPDLRDSM